MPRDSMLVPYPMPTSRTAAAPAAVVELADALAVEDDAVDVMDMEAAEEDEEAPLLLLLLLLLLLTASSLAFFWPQVTDWQPCWAARSLGWFLRQLLIHSSQM